MITDCLAANRKTPWLLALIVLLSGATSVLMLTRGHEWGDDFAAYLMQADSIVNGTMDEFVLRNAFTINRSAKTIGSITYQIIGPITYPWGFPLLLAPLYALTGPDPLALKFIPVLCYLLFLVAFFCLSRTKVTDTGAIILTAVLAFNPTLLQGHNSILSDIPFLLFSTLAMFLIDRLPAAAPTSHAGTLSGVSIGLAIFMAAFTRGNGLFLFVPLMVAQGMRFLQSRSRTSDIYRLGLVSAIPYVAFGILYLAQDLIFPSPGYPVQKLFSPLSLQTLWNNSIHYLILPARVFSRITPGTHIMYVGLLCFFIIGLIRGRRQDLPIHVYILVTVAFYILFPHRQGLRYIYPVLPFFCLVALQGMQVTGAWLQPIYQRRAALATYLLWASLAIASLLASVTLARDNLTSGGTTSGNRAGPFSSASSDMFRFIRDNTSTGSIIIFFKPRAMRLLTNRDSFMTLDCADLRGGDYVVTAKDMDHYNQIPPQLVETCDPHRTLMRAYDNLQFTVYQIPNPIPAKIAP
jgi:hypothetical protein